MQGAFDLDRIAADETGPLRLEDLATGGLARPADQPDDDLRQLATVLRDLLGLSADANPLEAEGVPPRLAGLLQSLASFTPPPARDASNRVSGVSAGIVLGEYLFNEERLSGDGQMSCATCHQEGRDWSDGRARGKGHAALDRRTLSLWNVGFLHWFGWGGAGDSLWAQSVRPILDPREMGGSAARVPLRPRDARRCQRRRAPPTPCT